MKKFYAFLLIITFAILLISCSKDDDSNKNATPLIQEQTFTVAENIVGINIIGTVTATDADKDILTFIIITNDSNLFLITTDGKLTLASGKNLDYETKTSHQITIQVSDGKTTASTIITINVTDIDENQAPTIDEQSFEISENINDTSIIATVVATDPNDDELIFSITNDEDNLFEITINGELSLQNGKTLDFETKTLHQIIVQVSDGKTTASTIITINVTDIDENQAPTIDEQSFEISENINDTSIIATVVATDPNDDELIFSITNDEDNLFEITINGELSLQNGKTLDFETKTLHQIIVQVSDGNTTANTTITINVKDVDENQPPSINEQTFQTAEDINDAYIIGTVVASDPNDDELIFSIINDEDNLFKITNDGQLSLKNGRNLDFETKIIHTIVVQVSDGIVMGSASIFINVTNVNDTAVVNIPDLNFKAYLIANSDINTNGDFEIQVSEANSFTGGIYCSQLNINDLTGIEAFTNITKLYCDNNSLTSLDLSNNTNLQDLYCYSNQLISLDIDKNISLTKLSCYNNQLTSLDLSNNSALTLLSCAHNQLTSLDVSNNSALTELYCHVNNQLTSLDLSNNTALTRLFCYTTQLTNLDLSLNTALTNLYITDTSISTLDLSNNSALKSLLCADNDLLTKINIANDNNANITEFNVAVNSGLECIQIDENFTPPSFWLKDATANYSDNCP